MESSDGKLIDFELLAGSIVGGHMDGFGDNPPPGFAIDVNDQINRKSD